MRIHAIESWTKPKKKRTIQVQPKIQQTQKQQQQTKKENNSTRTRK